MKKKIERNYLEICSLGDLIESESPSNEFQIELINPPNFQLNKFFYKNVGKKHSWIDRLMWNEKQWIDYTTSKNIKTYVLKKKKDLVFYFEFLFHNDLNEI